MDDSLGETHPDARLVARFGDAFGIRHARCSETLQARRARSGRRWEAVSGGKCTADHSISLPSRSEKWIIFNRQCAALGNP